MKHCCIAHPPYLPSFIALLCSAFLLWLPLALKSCPSNCRVIFLYLSLTILALDWVPIFSLRVKFPPGTTTHKKETGNSSFKLGMLPSHSKQGFQAHLLKANHLTTDSMLNFCLTYYVLFFFFNQRSLNMLFILSCKCFLLYLFWI